MRFLELILQKAEYQKQHQRPAVISMMVSSHWAMSHQQSNDLFVLSSWKNTIIIQIVTAPAVISMMADTKADLSMCSYCSYVQLLHNSTSSNDTADSKNSFPTLALTQIVRAVISMMVGRRWVTSLRPCSVHAALSTSKSSTLKDSRVLQSRVLQSRAVEQSTSKTLQCRTVK